MRQVLDLKYLTALLVHFIVLYLDAQFLQQQFQRLLWEYP